MIHPLTFSANTNYKPGPARHFSQDGLLMHYKLKFQKLSLLNLFNDADKDVGSTAFGG